MDLLKKITLENRWLRHSLFWLTWVLGFTFVKSFGASFDTYFGWLIYYIVTLPLFVVHTYLVVYWAGKKFMKGPWIILFILLFILLMLFFSFLELIVTNEFLSIFFSDLFSDSDSYLNTGNIVISGIGNLYIILVFAAAKLIREWYVTDNHKQDLVKRNLYLKRADANASVQPGMLLFSIEKIEEMELAKSEHVPAAIALLSEILNAVMQAQKRKVQRVDEEARIVKRMLKLYAMLLDTVAPGLRIEGEDLSMKSLPAFILFSPLEIVIRHQSLLPEENISIVIEDERSVQISWEASYLSQKPMIIDTLKREMDKLYPDQFYVESHVENDSYSVCILAL